MEVAVIARDKNIKVEFNKNDPVNRPAHYTDGKIEVIDFIEDKKLGFCLGNAVKYIARAGKKDPTKEIEDLKKARWYIERRIKELENATTVFVDEITHDAPLMCKIERFLFGESPSALFAKCTLGRRRSREACKGCKHNVHEMIIKGFEQGLKKGGCR